MINDFLNKKNVSLVGTTFWGRTHYSYSVYLDYDEGPHLLVGYPASGPHNYIHAKADTVGKPQLPDTNLGPATPPPSSSFSRPPLVDI